MRLLVVNEMAACVGGAEVHVRHLLAGLRERGHAVAFLHGGPAPGGLRQEPVAPPDLPGWWTGDPPDRVLNGVRAWGPDLVYAHRLIDPRVLGPLVEGFPSVFFLHGYFGVCITGARCLKAPRPRPCHRRFGWRCLAWYFPNRCGGLNPWTMWRDFWRERRHQAFLHRFDLLLTHSEHLRDEYVRHGFLRERTRCIPFFVEDPPDGTGFTERAKSAADTVRLLFVGRFDELKGGALALRALPEIARRTGRRVTLVMAGDGPAASRWRELAASVTGGSEAGGCGVRVEFPGWLVGREKQAAFASADLLLVPSVWPEPFGMTGLEAGARGVPAVAFEVGGVRAWLKPGVNGRLAPGNPPTEAGLAQAVVDALADSEEYSRLREGSRRVASEFGRVRHLEALEREFAGVLERRSGPK